MRCVDSGNARAKLRNQRRVSTSWTRDGASYRSRIKLANDKNYYLLLRFLVVIAINRDTMRSDSDHRHSVVPEFTVKHLLAERIQIRYLLQQPILGCGGFHRLATEERKSVDELRRRGESRKRARRKIAANLDLLVLLNYPMEKVLRSGFARLRRLNLTTLRVERVRW